MCSAPRLPSALHARLHVAIIGAFSRDELRRLLRICLDHTLEQVTGDKGLDAQVLDLLLWLERQARLPEFVDCACAAHPANAELAALRAAIRTAGPAYELPDRLGIAWLAVPGGAARLGSDEHADAWALLAEMPSHTVLLSPYRIARCPITNAQYAIFVAATGRPPPPHWLEGGAPPDRADHPVTNISWYDAAAFCAWAKVRLPSEAQWELAARGGDGRLWPWGNEPPTPLRCNFGLHAAGTTPAGLFRDGASPYGVLDMAGNVWEWTSSLWLPYPYDTADSRENPHAAGLRVIRGGCFDSPARHVRCAHRMGINPSYGYDDVGLRVVLYNPGASSSTGK